MLKTCICYAYFLKVLTVGGFPLPHPTPAQSLRSLAHVLQAPRNPLKKQSLEPRLLMGVEYG